MFSLKTFANVFLLRFSLCICSDDLNDRIAEIVRAEVAKQVSKYEDQIRMNLNRIESLESVVKSQQEQISTKCVCRQNLETDKHDEPNTDRKTNTTGFKVFNHPEPNMLDESDPVHVVSRFQKSTVNMDSKKRLLLNDIQNSSMAAFYAYMETPEQHPGQHQTLIFNTIKTNLGNAYNRHNGMFTTPHTGYYVFTWTIGSAPRGYVYTEIVVNSNPQGSILTNSQEINDDHSATGIIVVKLEQEDVVYIRTHSALPIQGYIFSNSDHRSSFSGWRIH